MDTYRLDDLNLLHSKSRDDMEMADRIFKQDQKEVVFTKGEKKFIVMADTIPELG